MEIKNAVTTSLTIFIVAVIAILGAAVFANQGLPANVPNSQTATGITSSQVAQHNNANDCWLIVSGRVYNVTGFLPMHSGGPDQIIPYCGKDATTAFATKNGRGSHRQGDLSILNNYYVGDLK